MEMGSFSYRNTPVGSNLFFQNQPIYLKFAEMSRVFTGFDGK